MEDSIIYQNCELLGRFMEGKATALDTTTILNGMCSQLCELLLVSLTAMNLISKEQQ